LRTLRKIATHGLLPTVGAVLLVVSSVLPASPARANNPPLLAEISIQNTTGPCFRASPVRCEAAILRPPEFCETVTFAVAWTVARVDRSVCGVGA
jgi:hypothetical protein